MSDAGYDIFISHASEDKDVLVRPIAEGLRQFGVSVWYDEFTLELGSSVSASIDQGISNSAFGLVVVSEAFVAKAWTQHELAGLVSRSLEEDLRLLVLWHGVGKDEVRAFSAPLADKFALDTAKDDVDEIVLKLLRTVRPDIYRAHPRSELEKIVGIESIQDLQQEIDDLRERLSEHQCPYCGSPNVGRQNIEFDEKNSGTVETFECGYSHGGWQERPCPSDPRFPRFEDYELNTEEEGSMFTCHAVPKTEMARGVSLPVGFGKTEEAAEQMVRDSYERAAQPWP